MYVGCFTMYEKAAFVGQNPHKENNLVACVVNPIKIN